MRERVSNLTGGAGSGIWISTFHSFCAQFLRVEGEACGIARHYTIYDDDDQKRVVRECLRELNLDEKKNKPSFFVNRISREKDNLMDAGSFFVHASSSGDPNKENLAAVYTLYEKKLRLAGAFDFGDLLLKTVELLHSYPSLCQKYQGRFQYLLVDEYQDTNRAQYLLTKTLAAQHKNICVVGDDDQAIYSWRGADIKNILEFERDYANVKVIVLEQNYRSTQAILSAAWQLVRNNQSRKEKKLWSQRQSQEPICVQQLPNEVSEAHWVSQKVKELVDEQGAEYAECSVFYRTNAQSRVLEDAFRQQEIPYLLIGNVRFYERAEVKDLLAYLKLIANPKDDISLKRIINTPVRGIGKSTLETIGYYAQNRSISIYEAIKEGELASGFTGRAQNGLALFSSLIDDWIRRREELSVSNLVREIFSKTKMLETMQEEAKADLEASARLNNVQELLNACEEFEEKSEDKSLFAYLEQVSLSTGLDNADQKKKGVTLMTVHLAKGLEFADVFLTGLEEGLFPLGEAQFDNDEIEEERRLAYVGMTRAKDRLFLTSSASRRIFGQTHWNLPSRFIQEAGLIIEPLAGEFTDEDSLLSRNVSAPVLAEERSVYCVGQRVEHPLFGRGKVTLISGSGDHLKVSVSFDSGVWKKLLIKYAPLKRI